MFAIPILFLLLIASNKLRQIFIYLVTAKARGLDHI
jgi:hypothetical protein